MRVNYVYNGFYCIFLELLMKVPNAPQYHTSDPTDWLDEKNQKLYN